MELKLRSTAPAIALTLAIFVAAVATGASTVFVPLLALGPLLAAVTSGPRAAAAIGAGAVALGVLAGVADGTAGQVEHCAGVLGTAAVTLLSVVGSGSRMRERAARLATERARVRADVLARAGELFETGSDPLSDLDAVCALPVPALADVCIVDLVGPAGALRAAAACTLAPADADDLRRVRFAHPIPLDSDHPVARVARTARAELLPRVTSEELREWAAAPEHYGVTQRLEYRSAIVVPLTARGRVIGVLSLLRTGDAAEPYDEADLGVARDLARRAGLAMDHSRLGTELGETESELRTVLGALAESVIVQDETGRLVYANEAAARLSGAASVEELLRTPSHGWAERFDMTDEHGEPIDLERMPGRQALRGVEHPEPLLMHAVDRVTGEQGWRLLKASPVPGPDGRPRLAVNIIEDVTEQRRREFGQTFLAQASKLLTASLDVKETLEKVAWASVPQLADWCAVDMPDEHGRLRRVATADRSPERTRMRGLVVRERMGEPALDVGPPQVMRSGRSELYPEITDALLRRAAHDLHQLEQMRSVAPLSVLVVPMVAPSGVIGTITLGTIESGRRLTEEDVALAEELGRRAGIAVEHSRIHGERSSVAATLQDALLPPRLPVIPDLTIAARFRAAGQASEVGGDFYDLFPVDGAWMIVMGDVTGKGPAAAAITSLARYTMRTAAHYERDPSRVLARLNHVLVHDDHDRRRLCTAVCARIEPRPGCATVTVACAGHPPPLQTRADGSVRELGEPGTLLGAFEDGHWTDVTIEIDARETLLLYTDGVTDTRGVDGRFGVERLAALFGSAAGREPDHVAAALDDALLRFQDGEQRDDVAVIVLQPGRPAGEASIVGEAAGDYARTAAR